MAPRSRSRTGQSLSGSKESYQRPTLSVKRAASMFRLPAVLCHGV
jgi:hypothetical protein